MSEQEAIHIITERLGEMLGPTQAELKVRELDAIIQAGPFTFALEYKASPDVASIVKGIHQLKSIGAGQDWLPLLATAYMNSTGQERCREAGVSWIDLAGNCDVKGNGLLLHVEGRPNQLKHQGRPASPFAPKSSRIARWLLIHYDTYLSQREIAHSTSMDEGFTSRIVSRLEDQRLVRRDSQGRVQAADPDLLLDAWAQDYDFQKHEIHRCHVPARSGEELLSKTLAALPGERVATGLAAAWLLTHFAGFRVATIYLREHSSLKLLKDKLHLRDDPRGANLWLVFPNDEGIFHGQADRDGLPCVHPVQAWLDLKSHPERSKEAADQLRTTFPWKKARRVR